MLNHSLLIFEKLELNDMDILRAFCHFYLCGYYLKVNKTSS
uniref:Uncharacterized protein n=1 Tax=Anguilla anguilla TaxID=7936 RepID=A0A0E9WCJ8_ANGAN